MGKYTIQSDEVYIGVNHTNDGEVYKNIISSYDSFFDKKNKFIVSNDEDGLRIAKLGDIDKAYKLLRDEIVSRDPRTAEEYLECVQFAIIQYFGAYSSRKKRLSFYPTEKEVNEDGKKRGHISDFGKKSNRDIATSLERAALAQNLIKWCCIDICTYFKISNTTINGKDRIHSYNIIHDEYNDKYYICDFSIPSFKNGKTTSIICEIPNYVYEQIISPLPDVGYSVEVDYHNLINGKDYLIVYDSGRDDIYNVDQGLVKKKV